jgi:diguanylate cyclase (GGDEF)-like protein
MTALLTVSSATTSTSRPVEVAASPDGIRRPLRVVAVTALVLTVAMLPFASRQGGPTTSFVPAMLGIVACFDVLSVYLLVGEYRDRGDPRVLTMSAAYLVSLVLMAGYAGAFPGVLPQAPLARTTSVAPWLYVFWHSTFPVLLGLAWTPWPDRWTLPTPVPRRAAVAQRNLCAAAAGAIALVCGTVGAAHALPVLIVGLDTSRMMRLTAPVTLPLVALALLAAVTGTRGRRGPERWAGVAVLVCLCDLTLTYVSHYRYSYGWYAGRTMTLASAAIVCVATLGALRRAKAHAERDATVDELTGLANRRSVYAALDLLMARARRTGAPLSVISFDIDLFKQINDVHGHGTGDAVLAVIGRAMDDLLRLGDVAARVGGEEFLVLLPGSDLPGATKVAERIRSGIAAAAPAGLTVTVSLGVASLAGVDLTLEHLLNRVDQAMYDAKRTGRNRTAVAA